MKRIVIIITAVALLSGCGMFQTVFKHKTSEKTLTSSSKSEQVETNISILDSSITTVIERIDTAFQTKDVRGSGAKKLDLSKIKEGLSVIDDEFLTLNQKYDPVDSTLRTEYVLKPQKISLNAEKRTEIRNNVKTSAKQNSKKESKALSENKKSEALVDRKPDYKTVFLLIIGVAMLIIIGWLVKSKK